MCGNEEVEAEADDDVRSSVVVAAEADENAILQGLLVSNEDRMYAS